MRKTRPAIVVSQDGLGVLPIKLVVPLTEWSDRFDGRLWLVKIVPDRVNGLVKDSAADVLQMRGVDLRRFKQQVGEISPADLLEVTRAVAQVVKYRPPGANP